MQLNYFEEAVLIVWEELTDLPVSGGFYLVEGAGFSRAGVTRGVARSYAEPKGQPALL